MEEIWKDVPGYEGKYSVSTLGRVKSYDGFRKINHGALQPFKGRILNATSNKLYHAVMFTENGKLKNVRVHQWVARTFIPNPNNYKEINHIDGNKKNNKVENLEWCTRQENNLHMYRIGLAKPVKSWQGRINTPDRSKPIIQYDLKGNKIKEWPSYKQVRRELGFNVNNIKYCVVGKYKQAYGFVWKLKSLSPSRPPPYLSSIPNL